VLDGVCRHADIDFDNLLTWLKTGAVHKNAGFGDAIRSKGE